MARSVVVSVCTEVIRDVWDMVTGFLEDNRHGTFAAAAAAIMLVGFLRAGPGFHCKEGKAKLMMH